MDQQNHLAEVTGNTLLRAIAILRFGPNDDKPLEKLKPDLRRHLQNMENPPVSRQTINYWFDKTKTIKRTQALTFLYSYIMTRIDESLLDTQSRSLYAQVHMYLANQTHSTVTGRPVAKILDIPDDPSRGLNFVLKVVSGANQRSPKTEIEDLFYATSRTVADERDQSYYLVYRYSTRDVSVVKSFLACSKPQRHGIGGFSFVQFARGGRGPDFDPDIFRENHGVILKMDKAYYFLGYNYRVPVANKQNTAEYAHERMGAKLKPTGLEIISVEYDDVGIERGLFPGLTMSIAAFNQPIVARLALLHLGTKQSLGSFVTDDIVEPKELRATELAEELRRDVARMKEVPKMILNEIEVDSERRFGRALEEALEENWEMEGSERLAERIIKMIDNTPAWESTHGGGVGGKGAVESYAPGSRPRF